MRLPVRPLSGIMSYSCYRPEAGFEAFFLKRTLTTQFWIQDSLSPSGILFPLR